MKILFITPWFPTPPVNGSKIRIFNLMKAMASVHQVDLISFIREGELIDEKTVRQHKRSQPRPAPTDRDPVSP